MMNSLPIKKVPGYGGKLGELMMSSLNVTTVGDILTDLGGLDKLVTHFGVSQAQDIWKTLNGVNDDIVKPRAAQSIISCGKQFPDKLSLIGESAWRNDGSVNIWVKNLCSQLTERLDDDRVQYNRFPKSLGVSIGLNSSSSCSISSKHVSESCGFPGLNDVAQIESCIMTMLKSLLRSYLAEANKATTSVGVAFSGDTSDSAPRLKMQDIIITSLFVKASSFSNLTVEKERITRFFSNLPVSPSGSPLHKKAVSGDITTGIQAPASNSPQMVVKNEIEKSKKSGIQVYFSMQDDNLKKRKLGSKLMNITSNIPGDKKNDRMTQESFGEDSCYSNEDIDLDVLDALPDDIKDEVLNAICSKSEKKQRVDLLSSDCKSHSKKDITSVNSTRGGRGDSSKVKSGNLASFFSVKD